MPLVHAKCTNCGATLTVDSAKDAAVCDYCGSAFIVEKAINHYTVTNHISANVVNVYGDADGSYRLQNLLNKAEAFLKIDKWIDAFDVYFQVSKDFPDKYIGYYMMCKLVLERIGNYYYESQYDTNKSDSPEWFRERLEAFAFLPYSLLQKQIALLKKIAPEKADELIQLLEKKRTKIIMFDREFTTHCSHRYAMNHLFEPNHGMISHLVQMIERPNDNDVQIGIDKAKAINAEFQKVSNYYELTGFKNCDYRCGFTASIHWANQNRAILLIKRRDADPPYIPRDWFFAFLLLNSTVEANPMVFLKEILEREYDTPFGHFSWKDCYRKKQRIDWQHAGLCSHCGGALRTKGLGIVSPKRYYCISCGKMKDYG